MWVAAAITMALQSALTFPALGLQVFVCHFLWIKWTERLARPQGMALCFCCETSPGLSAALSTRYSIGLALLPVPRYSNPAAPAPCSLLPPQHLSLMSEQHRPSDQTRPSDHHQQALHCPPCPQPMEAGVCRGVQGCFGDCEPLHRLCHRSGPTTKRFCQWFWFLEKSPDVPLMPLQPYTPHPSS